MSLELNTNKNIWKSEYNIGDLKLDEEHQNLFLLARKAININMADNKQEILKNLKKIISELFKYTKNHFAHEEAFMKKIDYIEYERHKLIHKEITEKLNTLLEEINKLEFSQIKMRLFEFINNNLVKHIVTEDKRVKLWNTPIEELEKDFGWKEIYSVGDESIDNQHKKFFNIAQKALFKTEFKEEREAKIKHIINELYDYMKTHFDYEEFIMRKVDYPKYESHKELHNEIITAINNFVRELPNMDHKIFEKELIRIIDITFIQHIIQEDRKMINWVKASKSLEMS